MTLYKELDYNSEIYNIKGLQFSITSPEEIKRKSVVHVTQPLLYDSQGEPVSNGLFDPRMGVLDHGKICPTDGLDNRFCPGYFGHIELVKPVFHYQFLDMTLKTKKCYCHRCSGLLDKDDEYEKIKIKEILTLPNKKRWNYYYDKICKTKVCYKCGFVQPTKYSKEGLGKIYAEWKESNNKELLTAERVQRLFRKISKEDCEILGFSRNGVNLIG